jgi:hypothetical protein
MAFLSVLANLTESIYTVLVLFLSGSFPNKPIAAAVVKKVESPVIYVIIGLQVACNNEMTAAACCGSLLIRCNALTRGQCMGFDLVCVKPL